MKAKFKVVYSSLPENKFFQISSLEVGNLPDDNENGIINIFEDINIEYNSINIKNFWKYLS